MKIYENLISNVAREFVKKSVNSSYLLIQKTKTRAATRDIESIMTAYLKQYREINQEAKDRIAKSDSLDASSFNKVRKQVAAEHKFALEKNNEKYLVKQLLGLVFQSENVEDVMVEDHKLERLFLTTCRRYFISEDQMEAEVKKRLFYFPELKEGTKLYKRKFEEVKEKLEVAKGLRNPDQYRRRPPMHRHTDHAHV